MNLLKNLRQPKIAFFLASLILFFSCESRDVENYKSTFDYSIFETIKQSSHNNTYQKSQGISYYQTQLNAANDQYQTDIEMPSEFWNLFELNPSDLESTALANGWLNSTDVYLMDEFMIDLQAEDFNFAINKFEQNVSDLNISQVEFDKYELAANSMRSLNDDSPTTFQVQSGPNWPCIRAVVALILSTVALASCITIIACGLAVSAWVLSYASYVDSCTSIGDF